MPRKILTIAPGWVGDLIMAQTLFKLLKIQHPDSVIDVVAADWASAILKYMPEIRSSFVLSVKHGELNLRKRFALGKMLRAEHYDQAIVLPNSFKSAFIPFWANI